MIPQVSWAKYLRGLAPKEYTLDSNRTVIVEDKYFFGNLSQIIQNTTRETFHDYFEWRLISTYYERLHRNYNAPLRRFMNVLVGKDPDSIGERWRACVKDMDYHLGHLLGAAYIERAFTPRDKALGEQIINDIKGVFSENLKDLSWMSEEVKKVAASKGVLCHNHQKRGFYTFL
jgi:endothelin-converting enzyme